MARYKIHLLEAAAEDAREAFLYYSRISRRIALAFQEQLDASISERPPTRTR